MKATLTLFFATLFCSSVFAHNHAEKFDMMDTDQDGKISAAEHEAGSQQMFSEIDKNSDGRITAEEMTAKMNDKKKAGKTPHKSVAEKLAKADANADKVVTSAEHKASAQNMFNKMDTNKDGFLTAEEMQAGYDKKMRK